MSILAKAKIKNNGKMQDIHVYNRYSFSERIDGILSSGTFQNVSDINSTPYRHMSSISFKLTDGETEISTCGYSYDTMSVIKKNELYQHDIAFVEASKALQGVQIDGMSVVQPLEKSERKTLYDVLLRLIRNMRLRRVGEEEPYIIDPAVVPMLSAVKSPQFQWESKNLFWECLRDIGSVVNSIPKLLKDENDRYRVISFLPVNDVKDILMTIGYESAAYGISEENTASALYSVAQNVISENENEASVVYPSATGWICPRSDGTRQKDDSYKLYLPYKIYRIVKIEADIENYPLADVNGSQIVLLSTFGINIYDITNAFVSKEEYNTLPDKGDFRIAIGESSASDKYSCNKIPYEINGNVIDLSDFSKEFSINNTASIFLNAITSLLSSDARIDREQYASHSFRFSKQNNLRNLKFRITYIPMRDQENILAVKDERQNYEFVQPFNQRTEVNSAAALGRSMKMRSSQLGGASKTVVKTYDRLSDIPRPQSGYIDENGDMYVVVANEYTSDNNKTVTVTHTLSQNWALVSEYVGVDRAYRASKFPSETVRRETRMDDYLIFSEHKQKNLDGLNKGVGLLANGLVCGSLRGTEINQFFIYYKKQNGAYVGAFRSADSKAIANSVKFSASFDDPFSAGIMIDKETNPDSTNVWQKECFYTEEDGSIASGVIVYASDIGGMDYDLFPHSEWKNSVTPEGHNYPSGMISVLGEFEFDKNAGEVLGNTYQCHFVADGRYLFVGPTFAESCPYVREYGGENKNRKFIWLKKWLPKTAVYVPESYVLFSASFSSQQYQELYYKMTVAEDNLIKIEILASAPVGATGWVITDENGSPLLGCNALLSTVYGSLKRKYHGEIESEDELGKEYKVHFHTSALIEDYPVKSTLVGAWKANFNTDPVTVPYPVESTKLGVKEASFWSDRITVDYPVKSTVVEGKLAKFWSDALTAEYPNQPSKYFVTATFVNGNVTLQSNAIPFGTAATYTGATPTKAEDENYTYTFKGWSPALPAIMKKSTTFTAQFSATAKKKRYTITFQNYDGTVLQSSIWEEGTTPVYSGSTPTKASDDTYRYVFNGWTPSITAVTGSKTYTAVYEAIKIQWTVTAVFVNQNGTTVADNQTFTVDNRKSITITPPSVNEQLYETPSEQTEENVTENRTVTFTYVGRSTTITVQFRYNPNSGVATGPNDAPVSFGSRAYTVQYPNTVNLTISSSPTYYQGKYYYPVSTSAYVVYSSGEYSTISSIDYSTAMYNSSYMGNPTYMYVYTTK